MTELVCPYCGSPRSANLKFCVSCGRPITGNESVQMKGRVKAPRQPGTRLLTDDEDFDEDFEDEEPDISMSRQMTRRSYGFERSLRQVMMNISYALIVMIVFYVLIRYVVKPDSALHRADKSAPHPSRSAD